jgi:hypothetical protein
MFHQIIIFCWVLKFKQFRGMTILKQLQLQLVSLLETQSRALRL